MEHRRKLIHITKMPIRWGDMDAYGHVNNTIYFRYMEQARVEWIEDMQVVVRPGGDGPVIINASCTFLVPMTYPGMVEVRTYVGSIGRSSFQTYVEMRIEGDDKLYAEGAAKVVWMNTQNGKSVPVPDHIRAALEAELKLAAHRIHESAAHGQTQNLGKTATERTPRCRQGAGQR